MDRRSFLVHTSSTFAAILTSSFVTKVDAFVSHTDSPLLIQTDNNFKKLYAVRDDFSGYLLYLGRNPFDDVVPKISWGTWLVDYQGFSENEGIQFLQVDYDISEKTAQRMLTEEAPYSAICDQFYLSHSANAKAYFYLSHLDLGPEFGRTAEARGDIKFIEGYCPGNDTRMVEVPDDFSLSLLQARLLDLQQRIKIEVID